MQHVKVKNWISYSDLVHIVLADVDECQSNNGGCDATCNNTIGSFQCSCETGYMLAADDANCEGKVIIMTAPK